MNSYKKLINNSVIFAFGTLGSTLISFLLVPLYTYYLSTSEYGTVDLTITTVNLLLPIVSVSAYEAVLRFTMDKNENSAEILTNSLIISIIGYFIAVIFYPILNHYNVLEDNLIFLYIILFLMMIQRILAQYTRAIGKTKVFSFNGILQTFTTGILNVLFLVYFGLGIKGYYLALIISAALSSIFLYIASGAFGNIKLRHQSKSIITKLINYTVPMMPNSLMWWLINASSRYFIIGFVGISANGLFAVASRIPSLLKIFYEVFNQAWQLSAIEEYESETKSVFYTNVFSNLTAVLFIGASGITILIKFVFEFMFSEEYYIAWQAAPFLLLGAVFSSLSAFLGTNYVAAKETKGVFKTSIYGGIISLVLNAILIPIIGIIGAGLSSMISFFAMFLIRYFDTKQYVKLDIDWMRMGMNILLLLAQILVIFLGFNRIIEVTLGLILFIVLIINNHHFLFTLIKLSDSLIKKVKVKKK